MQNLVRAVENDLTLRAVQSGLGAQQWEQMASRELLQALRAPLLSSMQARELLRVLGESGQRALSSGTLKVLLDLA
jgi:hypothetical protein